MADERSCEQCGAAFAPRREHARFCSARCRVAWNREDTGARTAELSALNWAITAMRDANGRLRRVRAADPVRAFAVIGEAVWWVTIVDGTLVRYHPEAYDSVLDERCAAERRRIEDTLGGLRFVRNQIGDYVDHVNFIRPGETRSGRAGTGSGGWTWDDVPAPAVAALPPRGQSWEMTRYRSYQAQLAGCPVAETFGQAVEFLLAVSRAESGREAAAPAAR